MTASERPAGLGAGLVAMALIATFLGGVVAHGEHGGDHQNIGISEETGYDPPSVALTTRTEVTWTNLGLLAHSVTALDGSFDSGPLQPGESFTLVFPDEISVDYTSTANPIDPFRFQGYLEVFGVIAPCPEPTPTPSPGTATHPEPPPECPPEPPPLPPSPPDVTYHGEDLPPGSAFAYHSLSGREQYEPQRGLVPPLLVAAASDASHGLGRYDLLTEAWSRNPLGSPEAFASSFQPIPHYVRDGDGWIRVTAKLHRKGTERLGSTLSPAEPAFRTFGAQLFADQGLGCEVVLDPQPDGIPPCIGSGGGDSRQDGAEASGGELDPEVRDLDGSFALEFDAFVLGGRPVFLSLDSSQEVRANGIAEAMIDHRLTIDSVRIRAIDPPDIFVTLRVVVVLTGGPLPPP